MYGKLSNGLAKADDLTNNLANDNEIIKALEICSNNGDCRDCKINPHTGNYGYCTSLAIKAALDLVNRQKAEIERLKDYNENLQTANTALSNEILDIKAEAIREFAKELMQNLDGEIEDYGNAGHNLNVYAWLNYYLRSKGAIESEVKNDG